MKNNSENPRSKPQGPSSLLRAATFARLPHSRGKGQAGEDVARKYLKSLGHRLLDWNLQTPFAEIDLVTEHSAALCIVEVKTRTSGSLAEAIETLGVSQQQRLIRGAAWLADQLDWEGPIRFDLVGITVAGSTTAANTAAENELAPGSVRRADWLLLHLEDAFEAASEL